jgi:RHS repeat-associated protein
MASSLAIAVIQAPFGERRGRRSDRSRYSVPRYPSDAAIRSYYAEGEFTPGAPAPSAYYAPDQVGSVRRVFTSASAPAFDFDPYGAPLQTTAPITDYVYAGMFYQADSGLYLTPHRVYSSTLGRWLSRDPIGETTDPDGNLYVYVGGEPINGTDTSGLLGPPIYGPYPVTYFPPINFQAAGGVSGVVETPGAGGSASGMVGVNVNMADISQAGVYGQVTVAGGTEAGGYFAGGGPTGQVGASGTSPTTGFQSANYMEADAGSDITGSLSASRDSAGNLSGAAGAARGGPGGGVGYFHGKSHTATLSISLGGLANFFAQWACDAVRFSPPGLTPNYLPY